MCFLLSHVVCCETTVQTPNLLHSSFDPDANIPKKSPCKPLIREIAAPCSCPCHSCSSPTLAPEEGLAHECSWLSSPAACCAPVVDCSCGWAGLDLWQERCQPGGPSGGADGEGAHALDGQLAVGWLVRNRTHCGR